MVCIQALSKVFASRCNLLGLSAAQRRSKLNRQLERLLKLCDSQHVQSAPLKRRSLAFHRRKKSRIKSLRIRKLGAGVSKNGAGGDEQDGDEAKRQGDDALMMTKEELVAIVDAGIAASMSDAKSGTRAHAQSCWLRTPFCDASWAQASVRRPCSM